jgi:DNA polymerase-4
MSTVKALLLCPTAVLLQPRFDAYEHVSRHINKIFREYTDLVEPLSLDEAYLDVTNNRRKEPSATVIARDIKRKIFTRTRITASAGVSYNKFLAKVASGFKKPNGLTVVTPQKAADFIEKLHISQFYGVGKVTEQKMLKLGITTGADLKHKEKAWLIKNFGNAGDFFYNLARGIDERPVEPYSERKSYGKETTFPKDINDIDEITVHLTQLSLEIEEYMGREKIQARTITLKLKYFDFKNITRSITLLEPVFKSRDIMNEIARLLKKTQAGIIKVRLVGISLSHFYDDKTFADKKGQLKLPF